MNEVETFCGLVFMDIVAARLQGKKEVDFATIVKRGDPLAVCWKLFTWGPTASFYKEAAKRLEDNGWTVRRACGAATMGVCVNYWVSIE